MLKFDTNKIIYLQVITFIAYLICIYNNRSILQQTLPLVCIALSACIILYAYKERGRQRARWLMFFIGYVSWIIGDILGILYKSKGADASNSVPVIITWIGTKAFFIIGIVSFIFISYKKLSKMLLFLDMFIGMILSSILIFQVYLYNMNETVWISTPASLLTAISMLLDAIIIMSEVFWFSSFNKKSIPVYLKITGGGFLLYSFTDMLNNYNKLKGIGMSTSFINAFYIISFIVISIGILLQIPNIDYMPEQHELIDDLFIVRKIIIVMLYPVTALVMNRFVYNPNLLNVIICFIIVLVCYFVALLSVCSYMKAQRLLEKEEELRRSLQNSFSSQMEKLTRLANEDSITKLYNVRFFLKKLNEEIGKRKQSEIVFVMLINIQRFKAINDIYGYYIGNMVLKQIGYRIKEWNAIGATIAKCDQDKFVLFKRGEIDNDKISDIAASLVQYIARPIIIDGNEININISIGISVCPIYAEVGEKLLHYADIAMSYAKTLGINKYVFFDLVLSEHARKKNELGFLLEKAVKENKFMLYYQPQFTLLDGKLVGAEALIRWKNEKYGFVSPGEFIPIAEELGIIKALDNWVRKVAFTQIAEWNNKYGISLKIGVNVSPKELMDDDFIPLLEKNIAESNVDPKWANIEITESMVLEDSEKMDRIFEFFAKTGMTVSVDDFGTGYSSMNYIKKYPFSYIKIDKSLIDKISTSESDRKIVKAIIAMSKAMNMKTVAEGIETKEQVDILTNMGCDQAQSFMFGRPVPPDEFEKKYIQLSI